MYLLHCRYVQYYADSLRQPDLLPRRLQLRRVVVTGAPMSDMRNLVVGIWVRPPGAGWQTQLLCLAATRPEAQHLKGRTVCSNSFRQRGCRTNTLDTLVLSTQQLRGVRCRCAVVLLNCIREDNQLLCASSLGAVLLQGVMPRICIQLWSALATARCMKQVCSCYVTEWLCQLLCARI